MRKSMPLRWIEEAEARQVLTTALNDGLRPGASVKTPPWAVRLRCWFAAAPGWRPIKKPAAEPRPERL